MEILDIYDQNRQRTGKTMVRGTVFPPDALRLAVHACIFNMRGEMLIQQRQPFKKPWPNLWDVSVGGSATAGESSQAAIERELFEELGLSLPLQDCRPQLTVNFPGGFNDIYLIEAEVSLSQLHLQAEEVQDIKWASRDEIVSMIEQGCFIPYYRELIDLFFAMKGRLGAHDPAISRQTEE